MYILPKPRKITKRKEGCILAYYGEILLDVSCKPEDYSSARILKEELKNTLGFSWEIGKRPCISENKAVCIRLQNKGRNSERKPVSLCERTEAVEDYTLSITKEGIEVTGSSSAGLWAGVQTLRQIIRQAGAVIPGLLIEDGPEIQNRGFYHDVTRGRIPTMEELKHMVDSMAFYKLNQFQLYVEHSFLFHEFSEVWRDDTPLTAEDILELDRYCKERYIELVPSIASFGHLYKVLRTKDYEELCELPDSSKEPFSFIGRMAHHTMDVTNEKSFSMVKRMLEQFMPLFTSHHFNVCADETFDLGTGKSKKEGERLGKQRLYIDFLKKVCDLVTQHGKIPMFWGDIISEFPEAIRELPRGTICLNWGYAPGQSDENVRKLRDAGAIQYVCPGVQGWNNIVNDMKGAYENISRMCRYAGKYGAIGVLNTDWGDFGHINHPEFSKVGMIYGAAFSWNLHIPGREEINKAISMVEYGDRSGQFVNLISELYSCSIYSWFFMVVFKEKQQGSLKTNHEWFSLDRVEWNKIPKAQETISYLEENLYAILPQMEESGRKKVCAYLLAAEGIRIFNQIGQVVYGRRNEEESARLSRDLNNEYALARKLEHWYHRYKELWRKVSRESELYRISEVIFWYGDYLRT